MRTNSVRASQAGVVVHGPPVAARPFFPMHAREPGCVAAAGADGPAVRSNAWHERAIERLSAHRRCSCKPPPACARPRAAACSMNRWSSRGWISAGRSRTPPPSLISPRSALGCHAYQSGCAGEGRVPAHPGHDLHPRIPPLEAAGPDLERRSGGPPRPRAPMRSGWRRSRGERRGEPALGRERGESGTVATDPVADRQTARAEGPRIFSQHCGTIRRRGRFRGPCLSRPLALDEGTLVSACSFRRGGTSARAGYAGAKISGTYISCALMPPCTPMWT